jgi:hypothetical protein
MRPLQLLLTLATSLIAVTLLLFVTLVSHQDERLEQNSASGKQGGVKALFSFTSPGSLFPPSAIISLTDDNSTFFLARPAAFGPALPKDGLSSGLWIGSGFGDDAMGKGELGCGDSSDWDHSDSLRLGMGPLPVERPNDGSRKNEKGTTSHADYSGKAQPSLADDHGTDDHLRAPPAGYSSRSTSQKTTEQHFDIQSLQESAEIDGKVVLLKRGGCGFLIKVMWAQKRGAVAVIVGDNVRGGGLIRMYAQGDTSNVTIPSLFTSHTTAHLLSSLLPGGTIMGLPSGKGTTKDASDAAIGDVGRIQDGKMQSSKIPLASTRIPPNFAPNSTPDTSRHGSSTDRTARLSGHDIGWAKNLLSAFGIGPSRSSVVTATSRSREKASPTPATIKSERGQSSPQDKQANGRSITSIVDANSEKIDTSSQNSASHEGLWVTLTPTNVSTSPFFDTLLVLVISPLVTLTVVYALLLLRSRIRRRRWRAPKSLVERLPVRTYQTMSDSASSAAPSAASPTTPLLQNSISPPVPPIPTFQAEVPDDGPATSSVIQAGNRTREEEKRETGLAEWRRRYGGRQKECVVCLDEYVDGVSQVMSLPCGHEFHAECM